MGRINNSSTEPWTHQAKTSEASESAMAEGRWVTVWKYLLLSAFREFAPGRLRKIYKK